MPIAPPKTQRILPMTCGSGKKGAKPKVKQSNIISFQLLKADTVLSI